MSPSPMLLRLPQELLREIIRHLVHIDVPSSPSRSTTATSKKAEILSLASTSKGLRAASVEFLFGSVDLFEASFRRVHRGLPSNVIIRDFLDLLNSSSFIREGVRRLFVRDRDSKVFKDPDGQASLVRVLATLPNLRSLHIDGTFYSSVTGDSKSVDPVPPDERLRNTLVNLTFVNVHSFSPLFHTFLQSPRDRPFINLTRIEYCDNKDTNEAWSPFTIASDQREPTFPHLSTFLYQHKYQPRSRLQGVLSFLRSHRKTLQRLSLVLHRQANFNRHSIQGLERIHQDCTGDVWDTLEVLERVRLLELGIWYTQDVTQPGAPSTDGRAIRMKGLQGLVVRANEYTTLNPTARYEGKSHPLTRFYARFRCKNIAYSYHQDASGPLLERNEWLCSSERYLHASVWFKKASQTLNGVKSLSLLHPREGTELWVVDDWQKGGISIGTHEDRKRVFGAVGGWSVREDAETINKFVYHPRVANHE